MTAFSEPLIVLTVTDPSRHADRELAERKNERYAALVTNHGGRPLVLDAHSTVDERADAFERMDGLLLTGGADIEPARYGQPDRGSADIEPERDELEARAWAAAERRSAPVLGICRGFQAVNVFSGGTLLQHVEEHAGPGWGSGPARMHRIRVAPGGVIGRVFAGAAEATVNTYHHQAVTMADLAPGLTATAWAQSPVGDLVEALEGPGDRFVVGVQCHPERDEFSPAELGRLWDEFISACRAELVAGG